MRLSNTINILDLGSKSKKLNLSSYSDWRIGFSFGNQSYSINGYGLFRYNNYYYSYYYPTFIGKTESSKTEKIVLVKNPVNPDLALWLGGVERLYSAKIRKLGLIHRGFSTYEKTKYRNNPEWQIAIEVKNRFPDLPMICDPSHISGRRDLIFDISQTALDLNFDGLMIESHWDPDNAWSDAKQQVTPSRLIEIMRDLKVRNKTTEQEAYKNKLGSLRAQIDVADQTLLDALGKRMKIAKEIGLLKKDNNVAVLQNKRWNEILGKMILDGQERELSEEFILRVFKAIHQESINKQDKILNKN